MSTARKPDESYEDYRKRIAEEKQVERRRAKGRFTWLSKTRINPTKLTPDMYATMNQGTFRSK